MIERGGRMGLVAGVAIVLLGCTGAKPTPSAAPPRALGWNAPLGAGTVSSYAELDGAGPPRAIGVVLSARALDGLPSGTDGHQCFDRNQDGAVDPRTECVASHEYILPLPDAVAQRGDIPFTWVLLNWNPEGHIPPGIYDVPHFDIHFVIERIERVLAIKPGPCGPEFVRCDQFQTARKPVPSNYMHPDFKDVEAVVPAMGNHLVDLSRPEFQKQPFTRTWIYGVYDGAVIFYEEMVTRAFLLSRPSTCFPIKSPPAVGRRGFYPTVSCLRHDPQTGEYTVSLEEFRFREAEAPQR